MVADTQERAEELGGDCVIASPPEEGTLVCASLPLANAAASDGVSAGADPVLA